MNTDEFYTGEISGQHKTVAIGISLLRAKLPEKDTIIELNPSFYFQMVDSTLWASCNRDGIPLYPSDKECYFELSELLWSLLFSMTSRDELPFTSILGKIAAIAIKGMISHDLSEKHNLED